MIKVKKHFDEIQIKNGDAIDFIAVSWIEPCWQFDYPSALIYPVFRVYENATSTDEVIENALIDVGSQDGMLKSDADIWRCNPRYIRRIASEIINGKFRRSNNISQYRARMETHRFFSNEKEGWLDSELINKWPED